MKGVNVKTYLPQSNDFYSQQISAVKTIAFLK